MGESTEQLAVVAMVVGVAVAVVLLVGVLGPTGTDGDSPDGNLSDPLASFGDSETSLEQLGSAEAFREYVRAGQRRADTGWRSLDPRFVPVSEDARAAGDDAASGGPDRVARSNVQVAGLDELDTVKTDGQNFYYSPSAGRYVVRPPVEPGRPTDDVVVPPQRDAETHVIDIGEPADPATLGSLDEGGKLIQTGNTLVVFNRSGGAVVGYDVSDPAAPVESWRLPLEDRLVTARETGGQLYLVTQTPARPDTDCPLTPLGSEASVDCGDVYAPGTEAAADAVYTAFSVDASSGSVEDSVSTTGTGAGTVVYMSPDGLYITYTTGVSESELRLSWAGESDLVPAGLAERIAEIASYNISERSTRQEMRLAVEQWSLPDDAGTTLQEDFEEYMRSQRENLTRTSIVRVDVTGESLALGQTGTVPGRPLDQFALDEYRGTLRITTTIPRVAGAESDNHLYVLDNETLARESRVTGMGHDQRVYSVRYAGDTAYVVTFRRIDPFYVVDFEDPTGPELRSELELPGFSSYLHPADDDHVIGIGEEDGQVKSVLFDVSDPTDTAVADDIVLDEFWSAVDDSHHAFMIDRRHEVFVLPAGNTANVVDYAGGELDVVKQVTADAEVTRARYVDDYLYVFAGDEVIVLDQRDWERTATLSLGDR